MELIAQGVSHAYDQLAVLDSIDLTVHEGEILALIGPSGCGKSTLLGILGGLLRPNGGSVATRGAPPSGCLNPFTYVFQDFALLPWRTVAGNVALALEHHALPRAERGARIADVLAQTGLAEFAAALPKQLSGGMRQRVGIARALAVRPAVLLLDEPLSALDAQTRELLMEEFLALWMNARTTAVYVTHNLAEALRVADRVCVLSRRPGRIREIVAVDIPQAERVGDAAQAELVRLQARLWSLLKTEAQVADREIVHG
ncbi:MAG: ABC transporter ATP-binding protein [Alphaproteobacteria bacterium]|nr:ABC transporter ATP-binding protein [Alphaproteobacteria bacterium]